jgi:hypothetical protein
MTRTKIEYEYKGTAKRFGLVESESQITTICEVVENEAGDEFDIEVVHLPKKHQYIAHNVARWSNESK